MPIFISGVKNIKPLIELLNELAPDKYLVKTLLHDQVRVQPTESSVHTTIIEALMKKKNRIPHIRTTARQKLSGGTQEPSSLNGGKRYQTSPKGGRT
jgi:hypothetical protein